MLYLCLGLGFIFEEGGAAALSLPVGGLTLDDTDGNPNTTLGIQSHTCELGNTGDIFEADPATNLLKAWTYDGAAFSATGNTFDMTSLTATDAEIDSIEISDSVYRVNATSVGIVHHAVDKLSLFSWDGTDFSYIGVHNLTDTSGNCMVSYLADNEIVVYTGNSAVPEEIVKYSVNPSTGALTKVGNSYTTGITGTSTHVYGLSSTRVASIEYSTGPVAANLRTLDFDGTDWSQTGNSLALTVAMTNSYRGAKWDDNTVFLWQNGNLQAYEFDGTDWATEGDPVDTGYSTASSVRNPRTVTKLSNTLVAARSRLGTGQIKAVLNNPPSAPANSSLPTIDNTTPTQGDTLTVSDGTWTGFPAPTFTYQWQRTGVDISGATGSGYTTTVDDVGETITCEVTGTNASGAAMAETAATSAVQAAATYMQGVESTCDFDCDATIAASASGTDGNMLNLISSPSSGLQASYDMLGAGGMDSSDFTGTAGDPGAYFNKASASEYHSMRDTTDTTLDATPATGTFGGSWWIAAVYRNASGANQVVWGSAYLAADVGLYFLADDTGNRRVYLADGSTLTNTSNSNASQDYGTTTDVCFIISADMSATTNHLRLWMNGNYLELPFAVGGSNRDLGLANGFFFGAADSGTSPPRAGISSGRMYAISGGASTGSGAFLTQAKMDAIGAEYETRHSRTY